MPREQGAYLRKDNWPDCIPWTEPTREYWPQAWWKPDHDPEGLDPYGWTHPDAGSLGGLYMGDVCPWCGVPLRGDEMVVNRDGERGELWEISPSEDPIPTYHRPCYLERRGQTERKLTEFVDLGVEG